MIWWFNIDVTSNVRGSGTRAGPRAQLYEVALRPFWRGGATSDRRAVSLPGKGEISRTLTKMSILIPNMVSDNERMQWLSQYHTNRLHHHVFYELGKIRKK